MVVIVVVKVVKIKPQNQLGGVEFADYLALGLIKRQKGDRVQFGFKKHLQIDLIISYD